MQDYLMAKANHILKILAEDKNVLLAGAPQPENDFVKPCRDAVYSKR